MFAGILLDDWDSKLHDWDGTSESVNSLLARRLRQRLLQVQVDHGVSVGECAAQSQL